MSAITIDTLHFANRLKSVGFTDEQAQVIIELQISASNSTLKAILLEMGRVKNHTPDIVSNLPIAS